MLATQIYAVAAGGIFSVLLTIRSVVYVVHLSRPRRIMVLRYVVYPFFLRRYHIFGPWTKAKAFLQLPYLILNIFFNTFELSHVQEAGNRGGTPSLINMIPLCLGIRLSVVGGLLRISLLTYRYIRRFAGMIAVILSLLHVIINVAVSSSSN